MTDITTEIITAAPEVETDDITTGQVQNASTENAQDVNAQTQSQLQALPQASPQGDGASDTGGDVILPPQRAQQRLYRLQTLQI